MNRRSFFVGAAAAIAGCAVPVALSVLAVPQWTVIGWEKLPSRDAGTMLFRLTMTKIT